MNSKAKFKENKFFCPDCNVRLNEIIDAFLRLGLLPNEVESGEVVLGDSTIPKVPLYLCLNCDRRFTAYDLPIEFFKAKESQLYTEPEFDRYVDKLHSKNLATVRGALQIFEYFAVKKAVPEIRVKLAKTSGRQSLILLRKDLVHTLWVIGLDEVVSDLIAFCEEEHKFVRDEALKGLRYLASNGNQTAKKYIEQVDTLAKNNRREAILERVQQDYPPEACDEIINWLEKYDDVAIERVQMAILDLAEGNKDFIRRAVDAANEDYRNILAAHSHYKREQKRGA